MSLVAVTPVLPLLSTVQNISWIVGVVILVFIIFDVWRSPASTGVKIGWTVAAFLCDILTLIVWLVWGRKKAYTNTESV